MVNTGIRYYEVVCKCGHVGRAHYVPVPFPVRAENGREAARIARDYPRVKHQHRDAILSVSELTPEEYRDLVRSNGADPYLRCRSRREQDLTCDLTGRMVDDPHYVDRGALRKENRRKRKDRIGFRIRRQEERDGADRLAMAQDAWETGEGGAM